MASEIFELSCKNIHDICDFATQAPTVDALMQVVAKHAQENHGMHSFPPQWWVQMRRHVHSLADGDLELI